MGALLSWLTTPSPRTDDPDPVTGLTSRDKYLIRSSWEAVKKDLTAGGVLVLLKYFEQYPEEIQHFPFKDIPREQLAEDKKFRAHCNSVMYAFLQIVDSLDDADLLVNILKKIGDNHSKRKIAVQSFVNLKTTLLDVFATFMDKETVESWRKALNVAFKVIEDEL